MKMLDTISSQDIKIYTGPLFPMHKTDFCAGISGIEILPDIFESSCFVSKPLPCAKKKQE